uniref:Uncharacterized protein n=1 Tax=Anguilla anguilla TaxID=7936 RepID=A0A0E9UUH4_ANGAN
MQVASTSQISKKVARETADGQLQVSLNVLPKDCLFPETQKESLE